MLYLIGLGLNLHSIPKEGIDALTKCKKVYLENYTVDFPYPLTMLEEALDKKFEEADRAFVEGLTIIDEAKKKDVALLVYGSPLTATTHITLLHEAKLSRVKTKVIFAGSVFDAIAQTGLQIYKFGKVTSMPRWDAEKNFTPTSFMDVVAQNQTIDAHSLILVDIGLFFRTAIKQLGIAAKEKNISLDKIIVCERLGTKGKRILYGSFKDFEKERRISNPYCFILPGKMHFVEKEVLEEITKDNE
jgi:diphthine synthase